MRTIKQILIITAVFFLCLTNQVQSEQKKVEPNWPSAKELIDKYKETQNNLKSFIIKSSSETKASSSNINNGRIISAYTSDEIRFDGQRIATRTNMWGQVDTKINLPKNKPQYISSLWDGNRSYEYILGPKGYNKIQNYHGTLTLDHFDKIDMDRDKSPFFDKSPGHINMGYFDADTERVDNILDKAQSVQLLAQREKAGNYDCFVIVGKSKSGVYKLWIDPEHGYNIAQATLTRGPGDYEGTNSYTLKEGTRFVITFKDVKFKEINGKWIPVESTQENERRYSDGNWARNIIKYKVDEIILNPDHDKLRSFIPNDIENGARAFILSKGGKINLVQGTWQDGKFVPNAKKAGIDEINRNQEAASVKVADNSGTIETKVGEIFMIKLESNITTGYSWRLAELKPGVVEKVSNVYKPTKTQERIIGSGGIEEWTFKAVAKGKVTIILEYVRPWEKDVPPIKKAVYQVTVK